MLKKLVIGGLLAVAAGIVLFVIYREEKSDAPKFRTEKAAQGDVVATVTATGSLSAVITVKVGSQVSGIIAKLFADFNSEVKKGQLLAELDPTPFQTTVDQRRADVVKARVDLRNAELTFTRAKNLLEQQLQAQSDFDAAKAARDGAAAMLEQAEGALKMAETNLSYTKIVSPIDGVVVDRQYDVGQTVAASFQAPTLFTIAQDITKMQVLTNIDEADIGRVKGGQEASFTVDAYPDRTFKGAVSQIRLSPQIVQNVVTYPVVLDVSNPKGELKPGMTANVLIPVDRREGALRVANAALRFKPDPADVLKAPGEGAKKGAETAAPGEGEAGAPQARPGGGGPGRGANGGGPGGGQGRPAGMGRRPAGARPTQVYVLAAEGKVKAVSVRTSITDGNYTAIEGGELKEGDDVVLGLATARANRNGAQTGGPPRGMGRM